MCIEEEIKNNICLVYSTINKYYMYSIGDEDIFQEGLIGLYNAIRNYDNSSKTQFSTYAVTCIKNNIANYIKHIKRKQGDAVLVPYEEYEQLNLPCYLEITENYDNKKFYNLLNKNQKNILSYLLQGYNTNEISKLLNISRQRVQQLRQRIQEIYLQFKEEQEWII